MEDSFNDLVVNKTTDNGDIINDGCEQYDINASDVIKTNSSLTLTDRADRKTEECTDGYIYNLQSNQRSAVSEVTDFK